MKRDKIIQTVSNSESLNIKQIVNTGIMRGGIHVFLLWIINNFNDNEVIYYNNIQDISALEERLITKKDTRLGDLYNKIANNYIDPHKIEIYSLESQFITDILEKDINKHMNNNQYYFTIVLILLRQFLK